MRRRLSVLIAVTSIAAASLGGALAVRSSPRATDADTTARASAGTTTGAGRDAAAQRAGITYAAELTSDSTLSSQGGKTTIRAHLRGRLEVVPSGAPGDGERVLCAFGDDAELTLTIDGHAAGDDAKRRALLEHLRTPFYVTRDGSGRVRMFEFHRDVDAFSRGIARTVFTSSQVVLGTAERWSSDESDATGDYVAEYRREASGAITKTKRGYTALHTAGAPQAAAGKVTTQGGATFVLSEGGVETLELSEDLALTPEPSLPAGSTTTKLSLRRVADAPRPHIVPPTDDDLQAVGVDAVSGDSGRLADERLVAGATIEQLLASLGSPAADDRARAHAQAQLAAGLRTRPGDVAAAVTAVQRAHGAGDAGPVLAALGAAGTVEAQQALATLAEDRSLPVDVRTHAVVSLGQCAEPTAATIDALGASVDDPQPDVRTAATLGLGTAATNVRAADPDRADDVVDDLLAALGQATTPEQKALALQALGNAGSDRAFGAIEGALADDSVLVRAAAAGALRFLSAPGVDPLLDAVMKRDPGAEVRSSAMEAVRFRSVAAHLAALGWVLRKELSVPLRVEALGLVGSLAAADPQARALVAASAESDDDTQVRAAASAILASLGG